MLSTLTLLLTTTIVAQAGSPLRIDSVVPLPNPPMASDPAVIWFDDFDGPLKAYTETEGELDGRVAFGGEGRSMICQFDKGMRGFGNRKVFFGDSPTGRVVRKGERFNEIYWRVYVKHQPGWTGGGEDKLTRITSITAPNWSQAMIGHVWTDGDALTLDPATGVRNDRVVTTKYNDFPNLRWLGNRPPSPFPISHANESGWWVCVETRVKLNTPGQRDGLMQLWIDGRLESERTNLDWRGRYDQHTLNAVFLESYWNNGSPVDQTRWLDNFVIATEPIGPVVTPRRPVLLRGGPTPESARNGWEAEVATAPEGVVAWRSKPIAGNATRVTVNTTAGTFEGPLSGQDQLAANSRYAVRARTLNADATPEPWSGWHQAFQTASK